MNIISKYFLVYYDFIVGLWHFVENHSHRTSSRRRYLWAALRLVINAPLAPLRWLSLRSRPLRSAALRLASRFRHSV
jgi:hypothetical protein